MPLLCTQNMHRMLRQRSPKKQRHAIEGAKLNWCCSRGRLFVIWILLCGFDTKYCRANQRDAATTSSVRSHTQAPNKDTGYDSGGLEDWGGMFGGYIHMHATPRANNDDVGEKMRADGAEKAADQFHKLIFSFLTTLLPSPDARASDTSFDDAPPVALVSILLNSKILDKAAELLRNDSLDDATGRKGLYMALIGFLRVGGTHGALKKKIVYGERVVWHDSINLLVLSFQGPGKYRSQTGSSLASGLRNLNIQSEIMLRGALASRHEFTDTHGTDMLWLCRMISDLSSHLRIESQDARAGKTHGIVEVADDAVWSINRPTPSLYKTY